MGDNIDDVFKSLTKGHLEIMERSRIFHPVVQPPQSMNNADADEEEAVDDNKEAREDEDEDGGEKDA